MPCDACDSVEEARDAADRLGEVVGVRQEDDAEWSGVGQLKPVPCTISTLLFRQQFEDELLVVRDRVDLAGRAAGTCRAPPSA